MDKEFLEALAANQKATADILKELSGKLEKHDAAGTTQTANQLHGFNGLFSTPGLEREVITAHIRPTGIANALPLVGSVDENPLFPSITGFAASAGAQPANACDTAPKSYMKGCNLTARFGLIRYDTNTIEFDKVMLRTNRGEMTDLMLRGKLLGLTNLEPAGLSQEMVVNIMTMSEMVTVGVQFERELTRQMWQGSFLIANEFAGLDAQIATGQKDAISGVLCPALDSDVKSYNYQLLSSSIVTYMSMLEHYLFHNATRMGLAPVQWVIAMRPELWLELTAMWPCAYNTNRCSGGLEGNQSRVFVDGGEMVAERDSMRNGMYIDINGRRYTVVTDDGIFEHTNINNAHLLPGEYASSIYFVPVTITGGMPATYREYLNYNDGIASANVAQLRNLQTFWTDRGIYSWALNQTRWCYDLSAKTEQRIILRTPQLAGRIDAVKYVPLQHLRSPFPDSPYFYDGGVSLRNDSGVTPYAVWSGR